MGSIPGVNAIATAFAAVTAARRFLAADGGMRGADGPHSCASTSSTTIGRVILGTLRRTYRINVGNVYCEYMNVVRFFVLLPAQQPWVVSSWARCGGPTAESGQDSC